MNPGTYLQKRREAAGFTLGEVARQLAMMQFGQVSYTAVQRELIAAEAGTEPLDEARLALLRHVFPFSREVHRRLAAHAADPAAPMPEICRECACSFFDPCHPAGGTAKEFATGTCWWVFQPDPTAEPLCSACALSAPAPVPPVPPTPVKEAA